MANQGLHLLHVYPFVTCSSTPAEPVSYYNCGNQEDFVADMLDNLRGVSPITLWKTSNWVCDEVFFGDWRQSIDDWHDPQKKKSLEEQCRKDCHGFDDKRPCADEVMDPRSSAVQHENAMRAIKRAQSKAGAAGRIGIVDTYSLTHDQCNQ